MKCGCGAVQTCLYCVHTYINIHERVCTMYIQIYYIMNMYVHATYIYIYSCSCTYTYVHVHDLMTMSEHVHTCLYHVQTRMYSFAQSCPGGQDYRCEFAPFMSRRRDVWVCTMFDQSLLSPDEQTFQNFVYTGFTQSLHGLHRIYTEFTTTPGVFSGEIPRV